MCEFGKVVLSRKGFDSSAGGGYSPFDPQTGKYVVLPIPMGKSERKISKSLKYEEIDIERDCLQGYCKTNLKSLMEAMGVKKVTLQTKDGKEESEYAHFDPWLLDCPWLAEGSNHQIGALGQVGVPQAHLDNQKVRQGSLFLFFSRFTPIKNGENIIVPHIIRPEHLNEGLYFIYGWLKVGKVVKEYKEIRDEKRLLRHPHATQAYFEKEDPFLRKKNNTIYIADELLFPDNKIPGCGYFRRLNELLCLSASDSDQQKLGNWIPSRWRLPKFFDKTRPSYLPKEKWPKNKDGSWSVKIPGRWQEAVFEESEEFCQWFCELLKTSC